MLFALSTFFSARWDIFSRDLWFVMSSDFKVKWWHTKKSIHSFTADPYLLSVCVCVCVSDRYDRNQNQNPFIVIAQVKNKIVAASEYTHNINKVKRRWRNNLKHILSAMGTFVSGV